MVNPSFFLLIALAGDPRFSAANSAPRRAGCVGVLGDGVAYISIVVLGEELQRSDGGVGVLSDDLAQVRVVVVGEHLQRAAGWVMRPDGVYPKATL